MIIAKNNTPQFVQMLRKQVAGGLESAAKKGAELYKRDVSTQTHSTYPTGPFNEFESASPGEFPARRTGQGEENIAHELSKSGRSAAFGVKGDNGTNKPPNKHSGGKHLVYLTGRGFLGPADTLRNNRAALFVAFVTGSV